MKMFSGFTTQLFLIGMLVIGLNSCELGNEVKELEWGVIKIIQAEPEPIVVDTSMAKEFQNISPGRSLEITQAIDRDIREYGEGAFGENTQKYANELFPGTFNSKEEADFVFNGLEDQKKRIRYKLIESYPLYISRVVEEDDYLVFAVENRAWFEVQMLPGYEGSALKYESNFKLQYGDDYVSYNEMTSSFIIDGAHVIYAITRKDTMDFYFMSEVLMHSANMRKYVGTDKFLELRRYFEEMSIYQK